MKIRWPYFVHYATHYGEPVIRVYHGFQVVREWSGKDVYIAFAFFLDGWLESRDWHAKEEL